MGVGVLGAGSELSVGAGREVGREVLVGTGVGVGVGGTTGWLPGVAKLTAGLDTVFGRLTLIWYPDSLQAR
jgi:hypothetical protein